MVVAVVHKHNVSALESKSQTPVSADPDRPVAGKLALEWVKSPAGQAHVLRAGRDIELGKLPPQPGSVGGLNTRLAAGSEKRLKALVRECSNHRSSV